MFAKLKGILEGLLGVDKLREALAIEKARTDYWRSGYLMEMAHATYLLAKADPNYPARELAELTASLDKAHLRVSEARLALISLGGDPADGGK